MIGQREVGRPPDRETVDLTDSPLHRHAPATRGQPAQAVLGPFGSLGVDPDRHLYFAAQKAEPQQGPLRRPVNHRLPRLTLSFRRCSMYRTMPSMTRCPARSLAT